MDFVELYYSEVVGCYPFNTDDNRKKTQAVIDYLIDAGMSDEEIIRFVEHAPASDCLTPDLLPDWMWEGSLLKKNTFYYHNTLHILSKPPSWNPRTGKQSVDKFYMEMKIKYGMRELIRYFYRTLGVSVELMDLKRDEAGFKYLMERYRKFEPEVQALDFVLSLIDYAKHMDEDEQSVTSILDIKRYEAQVLEISRTRAAEAALAKANAIVWR